MGYLAAPNALPGFTQPIFASLARLTLNKNAGASRTAMLLVDGLVN